MKATELMIGDWVNCDLCHEPQQIVELYETQVMLSYCDLYNYTEIEPISLTPAILAKNGLETKDGDEFVLFDNSKIDTTGEYCITRYYAKVCRLWICKGDGAIENEIRIKCQYVHELQHALKLCGTDKEIVL